MNSQNPNFLNASQLALQLAHDIRSPLSALNILADVCRDQLSDEARALLKTAVFRINAIASELLVAQQHHDASLDSTCMVECIRDILAEKQLQYSSQVGLVIRTDLSLVMESKVILNTSDLQRMLSNLINNAVESLPTQGGEIRISAETKSNYLLVSIKDNGKGIPKNILPKLGRRRISHAKSQGSGLGLYHARTLVESVGGKMVILSKEGYGTTVSFQIPLNLLSQ